MKRMIIKNWMTALLLTGICCGMVACDDEQDAPSPGLDTTVVLGQYAGVMQVLEPAPKNEAGEEPVGTAITATVVESEVQFKNFPIRDLVVKIIGDEELADQIVGEVGAVDYAIPYTALMNDEKTTVKLTLAPPVMKLIYGGSDEPASISRAEDAIEIEVAISAVSEGNYTVETQHLRFTLSIDAVKYGGVDLPEFQAFPVAFNLTKNNE